MNLQLEKNNPKILVLIGILSVAIPVVVALLLFMNTDALYLGLDTRFLPHLNAVINSATFMCLCVGYFFIKKNNVEMHRTMMVSAFSLSSIFLVSYVVYHSTVPSTPFGGEGVIRYVYYFTLITHILLSIGVVPLVLLSIYYALSKQLKRHQKIVKWAFPIWAYVAASGVMVYLMISPYYS